jgi:hypothetical protein
MESRRLPTVALIAANLVVAALALSRAWGFYEIIIVYWCEALIIGAFNMARMVVVGLVGKPFGDAIDAGNPPTRGFLLAAALVFFVVKFGGFAFGLGFLIMAVPAFLGHVHGTETRGIWRGLQAVGGGVGMAIVALLISHGMSFVMNFMARREYRNTNLLVLLFWPYARMSLVMVALAAGLVAAALVPALDTSVPFGVAVVLVKLAADLVMHRIEHASFGRSSTAADRAR